MSIVRKALAAACIGVMYMAAACTQQGQDPLPSRTTSDLPACQAAEAAVDFGAVLTIPDETKALVESYRSDWQKFCNTSEEPDKPTMADLLLTAKSLETQFQKILEAHDRSLTTEERYDSANAVSDLVAKKYPSFVPGFEGSYWEQEYFRPSTDQFWKHAQLGTTEDRLFFDAGIRLQTEFPPWMERTWDYGGCLKYGQFHWTDTLREIVQLEASLQSEIYKRLTAEYEASLLESLTAMGPNVCACERREAVAEDLQDVLFYLETEPALSSYVAPVKFKLNAIQSSEITVGSEAERHCSGG